MIKIGFIGLGKLGLECAEAMVYDDIEVNGFDINHVTSDKVLIHTNIKDSIINCKFIFIAVETPHDREYDGSVPSSHLEPKDFNYDHVIDVLHSINEYVKEGQTIVLISTVLPGTCREKFTPIIKNGVNFVYNPYLIAMGTTTWDMLNPEMVIIGSNNVSDEIIHDLTNFYKKIMDKKNARFECGTLDEAECIKIFYNTFISAKVSLVNMIQDVAESNGNINSDFVANALAKSDQRIMSEMYMKPGMGDGGPCHPRDNIALRYLAKKLSLGYDLFDAIMTSREVQAKRLAKKLISFNMPIVILGSSYKPNVDYTDGSYSLLIGSYIRKMSEQLLWYDDNITDKPCVYLLGHKGRYHDFSFNKGSVIVDPWREFKSDAFTIVHYGKTT